MKRHCSRGHEWEATEQMHAFVTGVFDGTESPRYCIQCIFGFIAGVAGVVEDGPLLEPTLCKCRHGPDRCHKGSMPSKTSAREWICRRCGTLGKDEPLSIHSRNENEYERLVAQFAEVQK